MALPATGRLRDGRVVIYIKRIGGESRFRVHKSPGATRSSIGWVTTTF